MGSSASKASGAAKAARKYPTRIPPTTNTTTSRRTNAPEGIPSAEDSLGPSVHPQTHTADYRDEAITTDASDPDLGLAARLRELGAVQPNPTYSPSSTASSTSRFQSQSTASFPSNSFKPSSPSTHQNPSSSSTPSESPQPISSNIFPSANSNNPAVRLLQARSKLASEAEAEFDDVARLGRGAAGRRFLDVGTVAQLLRMRDQLGFDAQEIESKLGLGKGVVGMLGPRGVVSAADSPGE